ncbi:MAG: hypothetical protein L0Y68_04070 [Candidatus Dadabacteria bacterium]|nr:hypothetical protein [Candidatus Dadabacteria bacterium]
MNKTSFRSRFFHSVIFLPVIKARHRRRLHRVLFTLILFLSPLKAYSDCPNATGDIPFFVTNDTQVETCIECDGPWFRSSGELNVSSLEDNCEFYAANITSLSPYGVWNCISISSCNASEPVIIDSINFCVQYAPPDANNSVGIVIKEGKKLMADQPDPPCNNAVLSFLGDNPRQEKSKPDADVFLFDGITGDEIKLRLEANPQDGNNGGEASLGISGNSLDDEISGALPLEIMATLPADGEYSITVRQPKNPAGQRFRGSYILRIEASTGSIDLIEPTNNVEK